MLRPAARPSILLLIMLVAGGCAGAPESKPDSDAVPASSEKATSGRAELPAVAPVVKDFVLPASREVFDQDLGPGVLMPRAKPDDAEVMKVAGFSVRKSHLYDRLFEINPQWTKTRVDEIAFDILLAEAALANKVFVDVDMVDKLVADAEAVLDDRVKTDWGGRKTLEQFLIENRGITRKFYRALSRRRVARGLLRYYVVRYLASREDRVRVRIISHRNRVTIQTILRKVGEGADFRSLALRESEHHATQRRGGLLPPFRRDSQMKFAKPAFELQAGEVSNILTVEDDGATHYYLLYCVERIPGRKLDFKDVKAELDKDRLKNPLTDEEKQELYDRLRSASESLPNDRRKR